MARDYDSQLLESVAVRRRRLRDALLFGSRRVRRTLDGNLGKIFGGVALAAVLCAGCVAWSFVSERMLKHDDKASGPGVEAPETTPRETGPAREQARAADGAGRAASWRA
ncbi:hypothetical protein [Streptomyces sp. JJ38]|uniref:hypothetical protein n=1 Tax=Streptomyces sp. JJ38 TaxID=2738128 RepID=UPI001C56605B|nr:hypothetical protein [Streptomyces sp. JJ38]MBW1600236.1 hypothetical protein [Streptomyces sp. JJ38]